MNAARFADLLDAYGAAPARWPEEEREAALLFLRAHEQGPALMERAGAIDDLLRGHASPAPSPALRAAVLATAPRNPPFARRVRLGWALALGLAGAGGALAGSAATAALAPGGIVLPGEEHESATIFGDAPADAEA